MLNFLICFAFSIKDWYLTWHQHAWIVCFQLPIFISALKIPLNFRVLISSSCRVQVRYTHHWFHFAEAKKNGVTQKSGSFSSCFNRRLIFFPRKGRTPDFNPIQHIWWLIIWVATFAYLLNCDVIKNFWNIHDVNRSTKS